MAIYLSLGPSGAGKDTLLLAGRALLEGNSDVAFIQRHLTRNAASVTDLEISVTSDEFAAGLAANTYALHWEAHGTRYGVPSAELSAALGQGRRCVLNVSRTQVPIVQEKFGDRYEVYVLHITASFATLRMRLLSRGRESPEDVEKRLARALRDTPSGPHVITILNEATVDEGATRVAHALAFLTVAWATSHVVFGVPWAVSTYVDGIFDTPCDVPAFWTSSASSFRRHWSAFHVSLSSFYFATMYAPLGSGHVGVVVVVAFSTLFHGFETRWLVWGAVRQCCGSSADTGIVLRDGSHVACMHRHACTSCLRAACATQRQSGQTIG